MNTSPTPTAPPRPGRCRLFCRGFFLPVRGAWLLLTARGVKRYALLPFLFNAIVYGLVLFLLFYGISRWDWGAYCWSWMGEWAKTAFNVAKWFVLAPLFLIGAYFTFTTVGLVIASPFNDLLSESIERALCGPRRAPPLTLSQRVRGGLRSVWYSLLIVAAQLILSITALPFLLVPVVGWLPLFTVNAYFTGRGFLECGTSRNFLVPRHLAPVLRERRWEVFGLGVAMQLLFWVPLLGLLMLPLGVAGGTLLYCDCDWERALRENRLDWPEGFVAPVRTAGARGKG